MRFTRSGAVIPSHAGTGDETHTASRALGAQLGFIRKTIFPEDKENITGQLEYVVSISGQDYYGCLDVTATGGIFNNHVRVRKGQNPDINPKSMTPIVTEDEKNGDAVWCIFVRNNHEHPLIVGGATHPRVEENSDYKKPSKSLGEFERYEFGGMEFMTDKDGNFTVTQLGKKNALTGLAVPPQTAHFKISKEGNFEIVTTIGAKIAIDNASDKITVQAKFGDKVEISAADGVQIEVPTGAKASFKSGKIDLESPLDISVKSTAGNVMLEALGGAKAKLGTGKVGLGGTGGEVVALLESTITHLEAIIDQIKLITVPTAVGPSGVPINAGAFGAIKLLLTAVKGQVTSIKGGI